MIMLYDKQRMCSCRADKLMEIRIVINHTGKLYCVQGWYNYTDSFPFGEFLTLAEAQDFVDDIHTEMLKQ